MKGEDDLSRIFGQPQGHGQQVDGRMKTVLRGLILNVDDVGIHGSNALSELRPAEEIPALDCRGDRESLTVRTFASGLTRDHAHLHSELDKVLTEQVGVVSNSSMH